MMPKRVQPMYLRQVVANASKPVQAAEESMNRRWLLLCAGIFGCSRKRELPPLQIQTVDSGCQELAWKVAAREEWDANILPELSDEQYVRLLYRVILRREADAAGLAGHVRGLRSGETRGSTAVKFLMCREFRERIGK